MSNYCPRCRNMRSPSAIFCPYCDYVFRSCSECARYGRRGVYALDCLYYREGKEKEGHSYCLNFVPEEKN